MAFIKKSGKSYTVRHGITGEVVGRHKSRAGANTEMGQLHKENKPKQANRGSIALKRFNSRKGK